MRDAIRDDRWECGSEFHWCGLAEPPFLSWPKDVRSYLLGRHAVAALIQMQSSRRRTLWLPSYFCPEVADACGQLCELREYEDDPRRREPLWSSLRPAPEDFVLAVNYFGVREGEPWQRWREHHPCFLMEDHTQDPFSSWCMNSNADYAFASLRKTLPVPDGALLWSPRGLPLPTQPVEQESDWTGSALKMAALIQKADYLAGRGDDDLKPRFRELQARGEQCLRSAQISAISPYSLAYIANGAPSRWREERLRNAIRLRDRLFNLKLASLLFQEWLHGAVPFVLVLVFSSQSDRDHCQAQLQRHRIYCPVHWVCRTENSQAIDLCSRLLSLPIDQRYTEGEMDRIADVLEGMAATNTSGMAAQAHVK